jgi:hypothetical protein
MMTPRSIVWVCCLGLTLGEAAEPPHWSLQPVSVATKTASAQAPAVIDHHIRTQLQQAGLTSSPPATPVTLIRRLSFDLIGLPPTPAEVAAFSKAARVDANAALTEWVERLLKSPQFGVRWGRHWLDVARYAESNGRESNVTFPHAWRYRDYVIDAFNADLPYDRFITEQVAGDLLPAATDEERARLLIATGFLAFGAKGLNEMNKEQFAADLADEQLDTVSRAVLASSIACARCHDHKTDPFSMSDYYALVGIFKSTETRYGNWVDSENNNPSGLIRLPDLPGQLIPNKPLPAAEVAKLKAQVAQLNQEEKAQEARVAKAQKEGVDLSAEFSDILRNALRIYWSRGGLEGRLQTVADDGRALPLCMGVQDKPQAAIAPSPIYQRGELAHPGDLVERGFPSALRLPAVPTIPTDQSGRLQLAQWLTHPEHPLTARVMVNRIWRHLIGAGLVRTTDAFGADGERPSHPELLDFLANRFVENGWSVKALVRDIVRSATYQQASTYRADAFVKDPDNRLLWRAHKRRLEAEVIRDAMLAVSGRLDLNRRPGSLTAALSSHAVSLIGFDQTLPPDLDGSRHRSVYLPALRESLPDALALFDFAEPSLVIGDRDVTNVPMQALYLMNGPFVQEQAAALAERLQQQTADETQQIRRAFLLCFNRPPDRHEQQLATDFFRQARQQQIGAGGSALLAAYCQALLASAEFRISD